jgi:hypothetical protein
LVAATKTIVAMVDEDPINSGSGNGAGGGIPRSSGNNEEAEMVRKKGKTPYTRDPANPRDKDIDDWSFDSIVQRNKPIIVEAAIEQYDRAEWYKNCLDQSEKEITKLKEEVNRANNGLEEGMSAYEAAQTLERSLAKVKETLDKIKIEVSEPERGGALGRSIVPKQGEPRSYKLDTNTKTFGGTPGERLTQWLYIIERAFEAQAVRTDDIKLALVTNYVKGSALTALIAYTSTCKNPTWKGFKDILKEQYEDSNLDYKLRTQLFRLKMEGSFPRYLARFQELLNQLPDIAARENDVVTMFTDGLAKEFAFEVRRNKSRTMNEAIQVCQDLDCLSRSSNDHDKKDKEAVNLVKKVNFSRIHNKQPQTKGFEKKPFFSYLRYNKKPFKTFESNKSFNKSYNEGYKRKTPIDLKNITCAKCKQKGHYANRCPIGQKKVNSISLCAGDKHLEGLMCVSGTVDGVSALMTLDSGATACIMSLRVAKAHKFEIHESAVQVRVADNEVRNVLGVTNKLHVEVKGHACDLEMYVMNHDDYEILLGLPWFMATQAGINPSERTLKFQSEIFPLDDEKYVESEYVDRVLLTEIDTFDDDDLEGDTDWTGSLFKGITPVAQLNNYQHKTLEKISRAIKSDFAKDFKDLGKCTILPYKIRTVSDKIIFRHPYRKSIVEQKKIQEEVDKMLEAGVISVSRSPHSSPILMMIPKKDGTMRMCIDYREVNKITEPENLPLPLISDIFDRLSGKFWFSALDLKSGYWQCVLDCKSRDLTAFSTDKNRYCFNVVPFGVRNAPGHFCRLMHIVLGHLPCVELYLDDICIASETFEDHCNHILQVFKALRDANLKVNAEKCVWFANEIQLLGHIVSGKHLKMDPKKVECVKNRNPPTNVKEVQQFLGMTGYYRRHIKDYAELARPLYELTRKDVKFSWGEDQQTAFDNLKKSLTEYPILRLPVLDRSFIVFTDSSGYCGGGVLAQVDPETGEEYVVAYGSRMFKGAERFYGISEKEALAIVYCLKLWRVYLCKKFVVISDHNALSWLMNIKEPCARLCRWAIYLQAFDFEIKYKKSSLHTNVDAISRPPLQPHEKIMALQLLNGEEEPELSAKSLCPLEDESLLHYLKYGRHLIGLSQKQKRRVEKIEKHYKLTADNLLLYRKSLDSENFVRYPEREQRNELVLEAHNLGHFAKLSTLQRLKERFYWKGMDSDVERVIARCTTCQRNDRAPALYHPAISMEVDHIFDSIVVDLSFGFPKTKEGYYGVLVIMERLTRFPFVYPIKSKESIEIAEKLLDYISLAGPSKSLQSDCGTEFLNKIIDALLKSTGIDRKTSSSYNPRVQGLCENFNSVLAEALRECGEKDKDNWHKFIPFVLMAYRSRVHSSHGYSPYELMFGKKMNHFDNWKVVPTSDETAQLYQRTLELKALIEDTQPKAKENMAKSRERQEKIQNCQNRTTDVRLTPGTMVYLKVEGLLTKMAPRYAGPYKVIKDTPVGNYFLENALGETMKRSYPRHKLKVVSDPGNEGEVTLEIDEVVDSKFEDDEEFFLVKWKNSSDQDWIASSCFNSIEPINAYNRKKALEVEKEVNVQHDKAVKHVKENQLGSEPAYKLRDTSKRRIRSKSNSNETASNGKKKTAASKEPIKKRGRPPKEQLFVNILAFCIVVLWKLSLVWGLEIRDDFVFCDPQDKKLIDIGSSCQKGRSAKNIIEILNGKAQSSSWEIVHVLNQAKHAVSGHASECSMTKTIVVTSVGWFGSKLVDDFDEVDLIVTERMCREMVRTNTCLGETMTCVDNQCYSLNKINKSYNYWTPKKHEVVNCRITNRIIVADHLDDPI